MTVRAASSRSLGASDPASSRLETFPPAPREARATNPRARIITSEVGLEALDSRWAALQRDVSASPFTGPALYRGWLEEHEQSAHTFVVVVEEGDELVAVAPWVRRGTIAYSLPGRVLVAGELVASRSAAQAAWTRVLDVVATDSDVRAVLIPHLTPGAEGLAGATAACAELGLDYRAWRRFVRYRLALGETSFEAWLSSWSRGGRRNLKRAQRDLAALGPLRFERVSVADGMETLRAMHMSQWPAGESHSWLHTDAGLRIDARLAAALPSGILLALIGERPVAATLWLDSGLRRTTYYAGRDTSFAAGRPGELVFVELVRQAFADGMHELDTMGHGAAKDHLRLECEPGYELVVATGGLAGRALLAARRLQLLAKHQRPLARPR